MISTLRYQQKRSGWTNATHKEIENHDFVAMLTIIDASSNMTRCIGALNPFVIYAFWTSNDIFHLTRYTRTNHGLEDFLD